MHEGVLGVVEANDKIRQHAVAAILHARVAASSACAEARATHTDPALSTAGRHAKASEVTAKTILPVADSLGRAAKIYVFQIGELRKKLTPKVEAGEQQIAEIRSKLAGLPPTQRFVKIAQSIDRGSDSVAAAVFCCDPFLADFVSEPEREVLLEKWQKARFPEEFARLKTLEADAAHLERTGRLLETWQRSSYNPSLTALNVLQARTNTWGAPGPAPINRALSLEQRAAGWRR